MPSDPSQRRSALKRILDLLKSLFAKKSPEPGLPGDPYAYVTAPKKPRTPNRSSAAVLELPEE